MRFPILLALSIAAAPAVAERPAYLPSTESPRAPLDNPLYVAQRSIDVPEIEPRELDEQPPAAISEETAIKLTRAIESLSTQMATFNMPRESAMYSPTPSYTQPAPSYAVSTYDGCDGAVRYSEPVCGAESRSAPCGPSMQYSQPSCGFDAPVRSRSSNGCLPGLLSQRSMRTYAEPPMLFSERSQCIAPQTASYGCDASPMSMDACGPSVQASGYRWNVSLLDKLRNRNTRQVGPYRVRVEPCLFGSRITVD